MELLCEGDGGSAVASAGVGGEKEDFECAWMVGWVGYLEGGRDRAVGVIVVNLFFDTGAGIAITIFGFVVLAGGGIARFGR